MVSLKPKYLAGVLVASFTLWFSTTSFCQTQVLGTISGTISDKSGAVIPAAQVTATNKGTSQAQTATTNEAGYFVLSNLPAGTYDVAAEKTGFQRCVRTGVPGVRVRVAPAIAHPAHGRPRHALPATPGARRRWWGPRNRHRRRIACGWNRA